MNLAKMIGCAILVWATTTNAHSAIVFMGDTQQAGGIGTFSVFASSTEGDINLDGVELRVSFSDPNVNGASFDPNSVSLIPTADPFFSKILVPGPIVPPNGFTYNILNFGGLATLREGEAPTRLISYDVETTGPAVMDITALIVVDGVPFTGDAQFSPVRATAIPEPSSFGIIMLGAFGASLVRRKRR